jgi:ketol-acid reductoisomerase
MDREMNSPNTNIYTLDSVTTNHLVDKTIAVIGYGNQGRAQALNIRDSGLKVIVGNRNDGCRARAVQDGFSVYPVARAVSQADVVLLLLPDEALPEVCRSEIFPALKPGSTIIFASGYNLAFNLIIPPEHVDVLLIAPRMIGAGVRERYLTGEGFYCFIGIEQDSSGLARDLMLELTQAISGFQLPAIGLTCKQEAILDLFNEQAFGPAFGRVLLNAIQVLLDRGLPPEAVLVEMYMSEEMAYTYRKMARVGLVRQTAYHSQTSQYGAMSRGIRFLGMGIKEKMEQVYDEIESGEFAREWSSPLAKLKFKVIRFFAMRQKINAVETSVRARLGMPAVDDPSGPRDVAEILSDPRIREELEGFEKTFEF